MAGLELTGYIQIDILTDYQTKHADFMTINSISCFYAIPTFATLQASIKLVLLIIINKINSKIRRQSEDLLPPAPEGCGKVMFSQLSVCSQEGIMIHCNITHNAKEQSRSQERASVKAWIPNSNINIVCWDRSHGQSQGAK